MTNQEALGVLGLQAGATIEEVKAAYREMAQILHPDKYNSNHKLALRATEQFKRLNQARDILLGEAGGDLGSSQRAAGGNDRSRSRSADSSRSRIATLKARLAGIAAARTQLTAQLDHDLDMRRVAFGLLAGGLLGFLFGERLGMNLLDALGGTALVWGAVQAFSIQPRINAIRAQLAELGSQRKLIEAKLESL